MLASINLWACRPLRFTPRGVSLFSTVPYILCSLPSQSALSSIAARFKQQSYNNTDGILCPDQWSPPLAQNNLHITGSREQLFEHLGTTQVDMDSPHCKWSSDASEHRQNRRVLARVVHPLLLPNLLLSLTTHLPTTTQPNLLTQTSLRPTLGNMVAVTGAFLWSSEIFLLYLWEWGPFFSWLW